MRVALVTAGGSGMGAACARRLAADGFAVGVLSSSGKGEALARDLGGFGVTGSNRSTDDIARLVDEAQARWGRVDVLVNSAGHGPRAPVLELTDDQWHEGMEVYFLNVVRATRAVVPLMAAQGGGAIINISSAAAFQPMPHMAVYGATKAFVLSFTEALWRETRRDGIRVLAVCPGSTDTPFFQVADEGTVVGRLRSTRQVLDTTMRALRGSGPSVVDGLGNAVVARFLTRVLPQRALLAAVDRVFRH